MTLTKESLVNSIQNQPEFSKRKKIYRNMWIPFWYREKYTGDLIREPLISGLPTGIKRH